MTRSGDTTAHQPGNRLRFEKSPYLLQHATNPVDWYPWGDEAFDRARAENRPIFLSIGYATCHWCHVMERESFEDNDIAALLNRDYICIKVDREERPDVDQVYMDVCVRLTGSGGWPLTLFLTPERKPFFAGTYFPKKTRHDRAGLLDYLPLIAARWQSNPDEFRQRGEQVCALLQADLQPHAATERLEMAVFTRVDDELRQRFDARYGGFGSAPKFPTPHQLSYLLRRHRRTGDKSLLQMVTTTLRAMRSGGIFDQVGHGFHRYATDRQWLVPHFEKMLYDQAGLIHAYLAAWQTTAEPVFAATVHAIIGYLLREMRDPHGGFYSAQDADSEGVEGKYYLWTETEVKQLLGEEDGALFCAQYRFAPDGNYLDEATHKKSGGNIPHLTPGNEPDGALAERLERCRIRLLAKRQKRVPPLTDDKVLTAWNGMLISALAEAGRILGTGAYIRYAEQAAAFILDTLVDADGRLLRRYRDQEAAITGFAEDYTFLAVGLLDLYRASFEPRWLNKALELANTLVTHFVEPQSGLVYETGAEIDELVIRPRQLYDAAHPATNSISLQLFARLGHLTGDALWLQRADALLGALTPFLQRYPAGFTAALQGAALLLEPGSQLVLACAEPEHPTLRKMCDRLNSAFLPDMDVLLLTDANRADLSTIAPYTRTLPIGEQATAYLCRDFTCEYPITDADTLLRSLG